MFEQASVLLISPYPEDYQSLMRILPPGKWSCRQALSWDEAEKLLRDQCFTVIIAESEMDHHRWCDLQKYLALTNPYTPPVIVTSGIADDQLWAEVLNLGGYNVLAKPFRKDEVSWVLGNAALQSPKTRLAAAAH